jgi:hypothetical protein
MEDSERKIRAALRRKTTLLNRTTLQRLEHDPTPTSGLAAISLVQQLTLECWALAGKEAPAYPREEIPVRFVRGRPT